jgi:AGZA family xanthine/uracil permease-like MFS transporter
VELRGALATFLTMAYILFLNPAILAGAGVPRASCVACTAAAAGICCLLMGLFANFPLALASGMGLNAIVAYQIAAQAGSWQTAMGLIVLDGLIVFALVLCGIRGAVMEAIPRDLRRAIGAGIGLFIAFLGLVNARLVVVPRDTVAVLSRDSSQILPPVTYGSLRAPETAVAMFGLLVMAILMARRVKGAIPIGILIATGIALPWGVAKLPDHVSLPSFANAAQADVIGALRQPHLLPLLLAFLMVDFFDTLGTVTAIADQARLEDASGQISLLRRILAIDALSACVGGFFGASSVTAYIESAAGVAEGARTGLHSVFVGLMFLLAIFVAPVAGIVPGAATAPALILVGFLMCSELGQINFRDPEIGIPAFMTLVALPLTYSISHGIGYGFVTYAAIKTLAGKYREVHPLMYIVATAFAAYFICGTA